MTATFHISISAMRDRANGWGDSRYGADLGRELEHIGAKCEFFYRGEQPALTGTNDVVLRIVGPHLEDPVPGALNFVWIISPPNLAPIEQLRRYDVVYVCSTTIVEQLRSFGVAAAYLAQAANLRDFHPGKYRSRRGQIPIGFVGSFAPRAPRWIVLTALEANLDVHVWGRGWKGIIPSAQWKGEHLSPEELADVYAASNILLNSHMPKMARMGMMSNRSFDALACGAAVISDVVDGFSAPDLPDLVQVSNLNELLDAEARLQAADPAIRQDRHDRVSAGYGFAARARTFLDAAMERLNDGGRAPPRRLLRLPQRKYLTTTQDMCASVAVEILVRLKKIPASAIRDWQAQAPLASSQDVDVDLVHPMVYCDRRSRGLAENSKTPEAQDLIGKSLRLIEALADQMGPFRLPSNPAKEHVVLNRVIEGGPLFDHQPEGFDRNKVKRHLRLWERRDPVRLSCDIGVFLHLYYDDLAPLFATCLARMDAPHKTYISTDTTEKAERIREYFPFAHIAVFANRGRDIYPKLYGLGEFHSDHDIVLHLHGKKSPHVGQSNKWLAHVLNCLLGSSSSVNRILSLFDGIHDLGMISPLVFKDVLPAAHWGANRLVAQELAARMGIGGAMPGNDKLEFPVGSMFWARTDAIKPVIDLALPPGAFPEERGQLDGTTAHAIERLLGVSCKAQGYKLLSVAAPQMQLFQKFAKVCRSNKEVKEWLNSTEGEQTGLGSDAR